MLSTIGGSREIATYRPTSTDTQPLVGLHCVRQFYRAFKLQSQCLSIEGDWLFEPRKSGAQWLCIRHCMGGLNHFAHLLYSIENHPVRAVTIRVGMGLAKLIQIACIDVSAILPADINEQNLVGATTRCKISLKKPNYTELEPLAQVP